MPADTYLQLSLTRDRSVSSFAARWAPSLQVCARSRIRPMRPHYSSTDNELLFFLSSAPTPLELLLEIREYAPQLLSQVELILDSGIRRGTDVVIGPSAFHVESHFVGRSS